MARLFSDFGNFSGKVGNFVLRTRNGKTYAAALPARYTLSFTEEAVSAREHFALMAKLSKAISDNFVLNHFWRTSEYPGESVRNKIEKYNYHLIENDDLSTLELFKPDDLFRISTKEITFEENSFNIVINPADLTCIEMITRIKHRLISAQGFIFLLTPQAETFKEKLKFIPVSSPDVNTCLNEEVIFNFALSYKQAKQMNTSPVKKLIINLALKDSEGKPLKCSNTVFYTIGKPQGAPKGTGLATYPCIYPSIKDFFQ